MKTKILSLLTGVIALLMFGSGKVQAQCAFIQNTLNCPVIVDIVVRDGGIPCTICNQVTGISVSANQTFPISCVGCTALCNIIITVTDAGGAPNSQPVNFSDICFSSPKTISIGTSCGGSGNVCYDSSTNTFIIY